MNRLIVSPAPHLHNPDNTVRKMMLNVIVALMPALLVSVVLYGLRVLLMTAFSVFCCMIFELMCDRWLLHRENTLGDLSAVVTGILMAFNLPVTVPLWMVAIGCFVAICIAKMTFGGLGKNPFNPTLVGRVFLLISFPVAMTSFSPLPEAAVDAVSGATPLALAKMVVNGQMTMSEIMSHINYNDLVNGFYGGSMGEISALALLLGFAWMLYKKVIRWHVPVVVLATMLVFGGILRLCNPDVYISPMFHVLSGGAVLGAVFMATDYVTSPMTVRGSVVFAVGIGLITMAIRVFGSYPEGMSFAILIMNAFVPLIDKFMVPNGFGHTQPKHI